MKIAMSLVVLSVCVLVCVWGQAPPAISETYFSDLTIHLQNGSHQLFGRGVEIRDQPAGKAVVQYIFNEGDNHEDVYVLERYDLSEMYTVQKGEKCLQTKLSNATMPLQWAWLKNSATKVAGHMLINGVEATIWELTLGYAEIAVAVNGTTPLVYWRRTATRNLTIIYERFNASSAIDPKGRYFDVPNECKNATAAIRPPRSGCLAGATAVARAKVWSDAHVPYSQSGSYQGYRTDCSGYVSMAWELGQPGLTTETLPGVSHPITKADLKAGDVLLNVQEHVVLFAGWANAAQTEYIAYEETQPGEGTVTRATPYPYWYSTSLFKPYRYNSLC